MTYGETQSCDYDLPDGRKVRAYYKENPDGIWSGVFDDDDRVFVINTGGLPKKRYKRNPYEVYRKHRGETVEKMKIAMAQAERALVAAGKAVKTKCPSKTAERDLKWDSGSETGMESGQPLKNDTRELVKISLFGKRTRTYLIIGKIIKP